jgi:hypothetical protein
VWHASLGLVSSSGEEIGTENVDQFVVYGAFGQIMHKFQVFELVLWGFLTRRIRPGTTLDQAMERVIRWDSTTFGQLWRGMRNQDHWPDGIVEEVNGAVDARNYLAHHFLREYFLAEPSSGNRNDALTHLANVANRLDTLMSQLEAHSRKLGIAEFDQLDEETRREIDAMRPESWLDKAES